jgi:hypothetical protein
LNHYAISLHSWHTNNTLLFRDNMALIAHVYNYSLFLHQFVNHLRQLEHSESRHQVASQLNVCEMRLELEMQSIRSHIAKLEPATA